MNRNIRFKNSKRIRNNKSVRHGINGSLMNEEIETLCELGLKLTLELMIILIVIVNRVVIISDFVIRLTFIF
jgi:hypothetical protein